ncbi:SGNH/GDSL hydrolase family protein [Pelagibius marinus]|uniref:SGNH/GDSL hydrolase family protein n=1 Tax=Pelagibius marinus TaxID=2762760 RepID=UPI0018725479|nr:SGNH/GDSL hydrolase family protein [Pelagibius marinus]
MTDTSQHDPLRITFFGDSICVGQGVSIYNGWVTRVAGCLERIAESHNREIVVTNASVNGNTTRQALERMPYDVQSHGVDILIVQFGMNDCNYWQTDRGLPRVSPAGFAANLAEIIDRGRAFGAKRIFLHNNHPTTRDRDPFPGTSKTYEDSNREYNAIVRRVGAEAPRDVVFIDIETSFKDIAGGDSEKLASLLLADGLHLSRKGHDIYFDVVADKIERCAAEALEAAV